ncbi:MAG TPA: acyl-CoA-binding protein [Polyangiaceae bacterium]|jgi:acyl-CoA-binding protein|nr:acyl-CoA-binding protein [Polyangiaceae bacterium]
MALADDFTAAQTRVKQLPKTPAADELLELYALYKQASSGDVKGERPGMLDFKGRAKFDAWAAKKGVSADSAMKSYVELVSKLEAKYR